MNIPSWLSENKIAALISGAFLLCAASLGYLSAGAWQEYGEALTEYSRKAESLKALSNQKPPPDESTRQSLELVLKKSRADLDALFARLGKFRVPTFGNIAQAKPSDQPLVFQDVLRKEVTRMKSVAAQSRSKLPATFYLGLDSYENRPPSAEELPALSKQLTILGWTADNLLSHKEVTLEEFLWRQSPPPKKEADPGKIPRKGNGPDAKPAPYKTVSELQMKFRCSQTAFREFINTVATAPYFLVIENLQVQNSSQEPPRRDAELSPQSSGTAGDSSTAGKLPVIVGREGLAVSMRIRTLEFTDPRNTPPASPSPAK